MQNKALDNDKCHSDLKMKIVNGDYDAGEWNLIVKYLHLFSESWILRNLGIVCNALPLLYCPALFYMLCIHSGIPARPPWQPLIMNHHWIFRHISLVYFKFMLGKPNPISNFKFRTGSSSRIFVNANLFNLYLNQLEL